MSKKEEIAKTPENNSFTTVIAQLRKKKLVHLLSEKLAAITKGVNETGRKGTLKLTLTLTKSQDGERILVASSYEGKVPEMPATPSVFFATEDNMLVRTKPNEPEFPQLVEGEGEDKPESGDKNALTA